MTENKKTGLWAVFTKIGFKILGILGKLVKATKFLKFGLAAASFASYAYLFTWKFSLLIVIALAWHESGHVWAMRKIGIKTKGFFFIPFLGGVAIAEEQYKTYGQNLFVAMMGPIWGLILSIICCMFYYSTGSPIFAAAAGWMAFLNLFNLFPVVPLDGGQTIKAIAFSTHKTLGFIFLIISLIAATVLMFKLHVGLFALFIIVGIIDLVLEFFRRRRLTAMKEFLEKVDYDVSEQIEEYKLLIPDSMNKLQIAYSFIAYGLTIAALIAIVKTMGSIPGADLAEQFLADR